MTAKPPPMAMKAAEPGSGTVAMPTVVILLSPEVISPGVPMSPTRENAPVDIIVSHPTNAVGYTLQSSDLFGSDAGWQPVTNSATVNGANWNVTLPITGASAFFRLESAN